VIYQTHSCPWHCTKYWKLEEHEIFTIFIIPISTGWLLWHYNHPKHHCNYYHHFYTHFHQQGRDMVYFFTCDPIFVNKNLIPDPKFLFHSDPWSPKISCSCDSHPKTKILIYQNMLILDPIYHVKSWSLIPKTMLIPDLMSRPCYQSHHHHCHCRC